jgi:beta-glucosidase
VVCSEWRSDVAAIVQPFYGGEQAGHGLADVLFGDVNPSARLPFTVPVSEDDLPAFDHDADRFTYDRWHGWWRAEHLGIVPAYPFGFGLSYTTFELGEIAVRRDGADIVVTGSVVNTGDRDGADVVQVYAALPDDEAPNRLVGFRRVEVDAGDSSTFEMRLPTDVLAQRDLETHSWTTPNGTYLITVARHVGDPAATSVAVEVS